MRHGRHRGATFEAPGGNPGEVLVARSAQAVGLVVGEDRRADELGSKGVEVGAYCSTHARCPVHVVARDGSSAGRDQRHWGATGSDRSVVIEPPGTTAH